MVNLLKLIPAFIARSQRTSVSGSSAISATASTMAPIAIDTHSPVRGLLRPSLAGTLTAFPGAWPGVSGAAAAQPECDHWQKLFQVHGRLQGHELLDGAKQELLPRQRHILQHGLPVRGGRQGTPSARRG